MTDRIPVSIWGATGFAGGELLRILARHPRFEVAGAISRSKAGT
ncbi:MAG: N-acetyl-gamma-glutamyl-phosphate reductase, partial [Cloacibacillus sp.]